MEACNKCPECKCNSEEKLINPQPEGQAPITGYRKMSEADVEMINTVKALGATIGDVMQNIANHPDVDLRWLQLANDNLQTGLMQATRSIAKPSTYA